MLLHTAHKEPAMSTLFALQKSRPQSSSLAITFFVIITMNLIFGCGTAPQTISADKVIENAGVSKGVCVLVGDKAAELAVELAGISEFMLYVQMDDTAEVDEARRHIDSLGLLGTRIFIDSGTLSHIHLADNLADALVVTSNGNGISEREMMRVLHPRAVAMVNGETMVKAVPAGLDDWTHPYHAPDNNPQSEDTVAKAPYLTQFLAGPFYAPLPQVTVTSAGRIFRAHGHIAFKPREEEYKNTLVAYNAWNGAELWRRPLVPNIMIHRSTMIATPEKLYIADNKSCKVIDAETGDILAEIAPDSSLTGGGTFWKWMALEDGVLYAMVGEDEVRDSIDRGHYTDHGWPWKPLSKGFNIEENPWGYGKHLLAIDPASGDVLWDTHFDKAMDSRSLCMKDGRLYVFSFGARIACLDTKTGETVWQKTAKDDPDYFAAIGIDLNRQDWQTNFRTESYLKAGDGILYLAGVMFDKLIALNATDGAILWTHPYDNFQLVLRDELLYGISGPWTSKESRMFNATTGEVLGEFAVGRRACARPTGTPDAIFFRGDGGSIRFDVASNSPQYVSPMRPDCFDGVTVSNGLLYWWPSTCDCQLTLYGATCLGPAGDHDFYAKASENERLQTLNAATTSNTVDETPKDWPMFRADPECSAMSGSTIPSDARQLWVYGGGVNTTPSAPVAVDGRVYFGDSKGVVHAVEASSGSSSWKHYTGGGIKIAPTVSGGKVFAGSGDGWIYSLAADTGETAWRFRAAPVERMMPVYGQMQSTWPVGGGVIVEDGVAYAAAGLSNYDNVYVYALDADSGSILWENNSSGHLNMEAKTGIGVQGHMLLHNDKLYMAGGNAVSPAVYDVANGKCLNNGDKLNISESISLRGWELYLMGDSVAAGGQPFYGSPDFPVIDQTVVKKAYHAPLADRDILWMDGAVLMCYDPIDKKLLTSSVAERKYPGHYVIEPWGKLTLRTKPRWTHDCEKSLGVAVCENAAVILCEDCVQAVDIDDGSVMWSHELPAKPVEWGIAVDRDGRVIVSLEDGRVVCYGG